MYCKDCKYRQNRTSHGNEAICTNNKITEADFFSSNEDTSDMLVYPYTEGGYFKVGPYFGCVHFTARGHNDGQ